jgi:hypothetical protein
MRILFPQSNWATNIGNPFFSLGVKWLVEQALPGAEVVKTASNPALPFHLTASQQRNAFNYVDYLGDVDAVMLAGPMLDRGFEVLHGPLLRAARRQGRHVLILSAGGIDYSAAEVAHCRPLLEEIKPDVFTTRDVPTFERYGDLARFSYSGICGAWFVRDFYAGYSTPELGAQLTLTFDFRREPNEQVLRSAIAGIPDLGAMVHSVKGWRTTAEKVAKVLAPNGAARVDEHVIIRPCHRPVRHRRAIFNLPNSFASFTPYGYLNLYRNSVATLTDRLHAAVATLAYGNPAYLFLNSERSLLLEAAGLDYSFGRRMVMDLDRLASQKRDLVSFVANCLPVLS